jgi:ribosome maturation factor RimP
MTETAASHGDDRIIRETGTDARIALIVTPVLEGMGYRLVRVRFSGQNGATLQIMVERPDGTMMVEDCEEVSRALSPALDVEDPVSGAYNLEVSSPGIDRPLVRKSDFAAAKGHVVKVETAIPVDDRKRFRGRIAEVTGEVVTVERDQVAYGEAAKADIPFDVITDARLVLTDDLIRDALKKDKQLRQERKRRRREGPEEIDPERI